MRPRRLPLLSLLTTLSLVGALLPSSATGKPRPRVAVLPFEGAQAGPARDEAVRVLGESVEVIPDEKWREAETKLEATRSAADTSRVARAVGADAVVLGAIRRDGDWVLVLEVRPATGGPDTVKLLSYRLEGESPDLDTLQRMGGELTVAVRAIVAASPAPSSDGSASSPPAKLTLEQRRARAVPAPLVDGNIGLLLTGRSFGFGRGNEVDGLVTCRPASTTCPSYRAPIAAGLRLDVTVSPLPLLVNRKDPLWRPLVGLGVGITYDFVAWPGSVPTTQNPTTCGGANPCRFATAEHRVEVGLRYRWHFLDRGDYPALLASLQYGFHSFAVAPLSDGTTIVPSVAYQYLDMGGGVRVPILGRFAATAGINGHIVLAGGPIQGPAEYGAGGGFGLRVGGGGEVTIWRGLTARVSAFYERFWLNFANHTPPTSIKSTDGNATDLYWGLLGSVGWVY